MDFIKLGKVIDRRYNAVYNFNCGRFMGRFIAIVLTILLPIKII